MARTTWLNVEIGVIKQEIYIALLTTSPHACHVFCLHSIILIVGCVANPLKSKALDSSLALVISFRRDTIPLLLEDAPDSQEIREIDAQAARYQHTAWISPLLSVA